MRSLLSWFAMHRRDLPWRREPRDAYRVWVSEIMLQQTRVATVLRYYDRFLERFPTVESLAAADEDALMKAWEGLGYYRRARMLQQGARHVAERGFPTTRHGWLEVPGVGPYTAGAIASLMHGERVPAVDGNVLRIFSRAARYQRDITTPAAKKAAEAWVLARQPADEAGAFNEALMELGATVCTPTAPRCGDCPIRRACGGRDIAASLPRKPSRKMPVEMEVVLAIAERGGRFLVEKRSTGLLAGTWGFPWVEGDERALAARVEGLAGASARVRELAAEGTHAFTHRRWRMRAFRVETGGEGGEWRRPDEVALGSAHRKLLRLLVEP